VTAADRFFAKVDQSGDCWLWTAALFSNGYGAFRLGPKQVRAHRWAYEHFVGPIPTGAVVMHRCDVKRCVNPDHLTTGSQAENQADMTSKGRGRVGGRNGWTRLTEDDVREIRRLYQPVRGGRRKGGRLRDDIAARFGVSPKCVGDIAARRTWAHVD
jgi:hypothetical protein